jgi:predicted peroxiredoxin
MKKVLAFLLVPLLMSACIRVNTESENLPEAEPPTDGAFIHISKGAADTHDVLMALMLADKFSSSNDVLVFFDKEGIAMVTQEAPNLEMDPFDSSDEIFKRLINNGATILACPACMEIAGVDESDLRAGVKLAEKEMFFEFTEGRILTLDY